MVEAFVNTQLSVNDFLRLQKLIESTLGIKMPSTKLKMLEARLRKRLRVVGADSYKEYVDFLFSQEGKNEELVHMFDVATTNKTDFYRETKHFDFLLEKGLDDVSSRFGINRRKSLKVWSAGCSSGEEVYTLAMVLNDYKLNNSEFDFSIWGSDISTAVLSKAQLAIYDASTVTDIDYSTKSKYLLRSKDKSKNTVRIIPELRRKARFSRLNLITDDFRRIEKQHVIFCRNVMIYFDKSNQEMLVRKFFNSLETGGYLFISHSETLLTVNLPLVQRAPSVYQKV